MNVGSVKICNSRQINCYNSQVVQDTHIVSIKVKQQVICIPSNGDFASGLGRRLSTPNHPNFHIVDVDFHIFVAGNYIETLDFVCALNPEIPVDG